MLVTDWLGPIRSHSLSWGVGSAWRVAPGSRGWQPHLQLQGTRPGSCWGRREGTGSIRGNEQSPTSGPQGLHEPALPYLALDLCAL